MDYQDFIGKPKQFLALTSIEVDEFNALLKVFTPLWERHYRYNTLEGKKRAFPTNKEHGKCVLRGTGQKLFFLLVYLKTNSLQEHQAAIFGISQPVVSRISKTLLTVLNQALKEMHLAPCRDGEELLKRLSEYKERAFNYDGTDRDINRNVDQKAQKEEFSGKHHSHTIKNLVLSDDSKFIHYLSPTEIGSCHDKAMADEYPILLPKGSVCRQDLGFLGHNPVGVIIEQPFKKPKGGELSFSQKLYNKMLSAMRVSIEHVNSGIKRLRLVKDAIRIRNTEFRDEVMVVACGLHNLRVKSPARAYQKLAHASL